MTISSVQLFVAFSKLFKTTEPDKASVLQFGVQEPDFDSVDIDHNEYLEIDEALRSHTISELLYSNMVSSYGSGEADDASKKSEKAKSGKNSNMIEGIDPSVTVGNNPFI